ncbi:hypothetical protein HK405_003756, partial [Cladochytrium tenue]
MEVGNVGGTVAATDSAAAPGAVMEPRALDEVDAADRPVIEGGSAVGDGGSTDATGVLSSAQAVPAYPMEGIQLDPSAEVGASFDEKEGEGAGYPPGASPTVSAEIHGGSVRDADESSAAATVDAPAADVSSAALVGPTSPQPPITMSAVPLLSPVVPPTATPAPAPSATAIPSSATEPVTTAGSTNAPVAGAISTVSAVATAAPAGMARAFAATVADDTDDYGAVNYRPINRGQKLRGRTMEPPGARVEPGRPALGAMHAIEEHTKFERIGKKRVLARRGNPVALAAAAARRDPGDVQENPYAGITIEGLWGPLEKVSDVSRNRAAVHTLRSRSVRALASTAMDMIEDTAGPAIGQPSAYRALGRVASWAYQDEPSLGPDPYELGVPAEVVDEFRATVETCLCVNNERLRYLARIRDRLNVVHSRKKRLARALVPFAKSDGPNNSVGGTTTRMTTAEAAGSSGTQQQQELQQAAAAVAAAGPRPSSQQRRQQLGSLQPASVSGMGIGGGGRTGGSGPPPLAM